MPEGSVGDSDAIRARHVSPFARQREDYRRGDNEPPSLGQARQSRKGLLRIFSHGTTSKRRPLFRRSRQLKSSRRRRPLAQNVSSLHSHEGDVINRDSSRYLPTRSSFGMGAPIRSDMRIASAPLEPSTSACLSSSLADSWQNSASSNLSSRRTENRDSSRLHRGDDGLRDLVDLELKLNSLENGFLFAGRYRIKPEEVHGRPHCRYAVERSTGQEVFLKFFPRRFQEFENAVKAHRALHSEYKYICRMIDNIESIHGFPPCLVLERGRYTLADRMAGRQMSPIEQRAALYSVLEALECIHTQGIVHGDLDPAHIMWFATDFSWKLIDLSTAARPEEPRPQSNAGRFACPELTRNLKQGLRQIRLKPSMDMCVTRI